MNAAPLIEPAEWPWRLPVIRHLRAIYYAWRVAVWEDEWRSVGMTPQSFDWKVIEQIKKGIV